MKMRFSIRPKSIRSKLAVNFTFAFGLTLILTSGFCYHIFVQTHQENFDASLYNHAIDVAAAIDANILGGIEIHPFSNLEFEKMEPFMIDRSYMDVRETGGKILGATQNLKDKGLPYSDFIRTNVLSSGVDFVTMKGGEIGGGKHIDYRLISYLVNKPGLYPMILQIAVPLTAIQEEQSKFFQLLLFLIPSGILISTGLALWASRRAFSPVLLMTKQTAQIEVKNLKDRIQVIESDEELRELGKTLNLLLDRIETSVVAQDRFVADASHQLKTPLAIMQGELELLIQNPESAELNTSLKSIKQEVSQMINLVDNLLLLARMDAGYTTIPFHTVRLDEIIFEAVRRYSRVAEQAGIKLSIDLIPDQTHTDTEIDFELQGDTYLLRCLVENLIDNSVKYSKNSDFNTKKVIVVRLKELHDLYILEVEDHGMGLTAEEIAGLFKRFQRDSKKSLEAKGAGLGLTIVKRIAELHGGNITFSSSPDLGTIAHVELKKS